MEINKYGIFSILMLGIIVACSSDNKLRSFCYFTNWSNEISSYDARFFIQDINTTLCTHLIYAFAKIDFANVKLIPSSPKDDNGQTYRKAGRYFDFNNLKIEHPHLTTLLSVGGASNKGAGFLQIAQSRGLMVEFARNCAIYLRDRNFDGLDIDWEYPSDATRDSYTELIKTMYEEFEKDAKKRKKPRLLISVAVGATSELINEVYNVTEISKYVDYLLVMSYDFHTYSVTTFSDPLFSRKSNQQFNQEYSQEWAIDHWISAGAPSSKIVMGITAAAPTFTLANISNTDVGAPVASRGQAGPYLQREGQATYFRVCEMRRHGAVMKWDEEQKMAYAVQGDQWVGYNTPKSMEEKVKFAYSKYLAGTMFWSLDLDDFKGKYCNGGKYPLMAAIHSAILEFEPKIPYTGSPTPTPTSPPSTTPIDFRLHHRTNRNGVNYFDMRNGAANICLNTFITVAFGLIYIVQRLLLS